MLGKVCPFDGHFIIEHYNIFSEEKVARAPLKRQNVMKEICKHTYVLKLKACYSRRIKVEETMIKLCNTKNCLSKFSEPSYRII